jgi:hypothetical protein
VARLTLSRCAVGAAGAGALADALRAGAPLTHLTLTGNDAIGDAGAESLAAALFLTASAARRDAADADANGAAAPPPPRLARLDLGACGIGAAGAVALLRAGGVGALSLFGNESLGDDGAAAIAAALSSASSALLSGLTGLDLSGTRIGREGGAALAAALAAGAAPGLLTLELGANPVRLSAHCFCALLLLHYYACSPAAPLARIVARTPCTPRLTHPPSPSPRRAAPRS